MNATLELPPPYHGYDADTGRYWHFGYGSNISFLKVRGNLFGVGSPNYPSPEDKLFNDGTVGWIGNYSLGVRNLTDKGNGTANLAPARGEDKVYGVLYSLTLNQFKRMWECEGGSAATLVPVDVHLIEGRVVPASTWIFLTDQGTADCDPEANVKRYYFELIAEAATARKTIPASYIDSVLMSRVLQKKKL